MALCSGAVASEGAAAGGGGSGVLLEEPGAAGEGAGRGRRWSEWQRGERSCWRNLQESPPSLPEGRKRKDVYTPAL